MEREKPIDIYSYKPGKKMARLSFKTELAVTQGQETSAVGFARQRAELNWSLTGNSNTE